MGSDATGVERIVIPLSGSFTVTHTEKGETTVTELEGRPNVFAGPSDSLYLSPAATFSIRLSDGAGGNSAGHGRVAVAESPVVSSGQEPTAIHPTRYIAAAEVPVELRGAGQSSRQVHNFGTPDALDAHRFIVCEVITPHGNWSSYPPHKHDEHLPGHETQLEEIYYFEAAPAGGANAPNPEEAFGLFSAYSSPTGPLEVDGMVRTGDVVLLPFGYHGPAVAAPGYDLYYLNVMAGPDPERAWLISDDPAHGWVRELWEQEPVDPRLPYTESNARESNAQAEGVQQ